ncbi:unnamed protein product [Staurois parvus]|uniref:Uncharacterized protein n=1 Tax=Staurois parvus TaxID=386267 RepID=A0ABN9H6J5_9NEOB|nr:unnamed protein product [Staurois parvus]
MLLPGPESLMGPYTASSCCCQAPNLPWAPIPPPHAAARSTVSHGVPVPPPIAAARPLICHGPPYRLLMLLPGPKSAMGPRTAWSRCCWVHSVSWVPVPPPIAPHSAMCHFQVSHTPAVFHFVIGCWQITGLP